MVVVIEQARSGNDTMSGPLPSLGHSDFESGQLITLPWPLRVQVKGSGPVSSQIGSSE